MDIAVAPAYDPPTHARKDASETQIHPATSMIAATSMHHATSELFAQTCVGCVAASRSLTAHPAYAPMFGHVLLPRGNRLPYAPDVVPGSPERTVCRGGAGIQAGET